MASLEISYPRVYKDYLVVSDQSIEDVIEFYEENTDSINVLDFEKKFEIRNFYAQALFEMGQYRKFLNQVDWLIVKIIEENIYAFNGTDLYQYCIFRKAAALYNLNDSRRALKVAEKLVSINPRSKTYSLLLKRCYLRNGYAALISWQLAGSLVLMAGVMVYCFEIYYVRPRGLASATSFEGFRITIGIIGLLLIALPEIWQQFRAMKMVQRTKKQRAS